MQQRRDAEASKQSRPRQKEQTFQQGATEIGGKIATAVLIKDRQKQEKNDDENILKQRDAERSPRTGAILLTGILKRFHRDGGRAQGHRDTEHDAIDGGKSQRGRKPTRQERSDRHL